MRWEQFESAEPDLADKVLSRFGAHSHHVLATLKADGSPRVSGVNVEFFGGEMWLGCMPGSLKGADLVRDGRCAVHSAPLDESLGEPDVKVDAIARELDDGEVREWLEQYRLLKGGTSSVDGAQVFRLDLLRVSAVTVSGEDLVVDTWHHRNGRRILRRR